MEFPAGAKLGSACRFLFGQPAALMFLGIMKHEGPVLRRISYVLRGMPINLNVRKDLKMPEQIKLNDGSAIPQLGLGVWQVDPAITAQVVSWGIEAGYRSIDTAEGYGNEEGVGQAIRTAGVPRSELFITSKLRNGAHQRDRRAASFRRDDGASSG